MLWDYVYQHSCVYTIYTVCILSVCVCIVCFWMLMLWTHLCVSFVCISTSLSLPGESCYSFVCHAYFKCSTEKHIFTQLRKAFPSPPSNNLYFIGVLTNLWLICTTPLSIHLRTDCSPVPEIYCAIVATASSLCFCPACFWFLNFELICLHWPHSNQTGSVI